MSDNRLDLVLVCYVANGIKCTFFFFQKLPIFFLEEPKATNIDCIKIM